MSSGADAQAFQIWIRSLRNRPRINLAEQDFSAWLQDEIDQSRLERSAARARDLPDGPVSLSATQKLQISVVDIEKQEQTIDGESVSAPESPSQQPVPENSYGSALVSLYVQIRQMPRLTRGTA